MLSKTGVWFYSGYMVLDPPLQRIYKFVYLKFKSYSASNAETGCMSSWFLTCSTKIVVTYGRHVQELPVITELSYSWVSLHKTTRVVTISNSSSLVHPVCLRFSNAFHYDDVIMDAIAPQITSLTIVYSTIYSGGDHSKHQSSASLAFVWGIHRRPVNSPHKWPVTRKMFPFDDVIMLLVDWDIWSHFTNVI